MEPNRFGELYCVLFGHEWNETGSYTDSETGIVLSHYKQCRRCHLRIVDESGYKRLREQEKTRKPLA